MGRNRTHKKAKKEAENSDDFTWQMKEIEQIGDDISELIENLHKNQKMPVEIKEQLIKEYEDKVSSCNTTLNLLKKGKK